MGIENIFCKYFFQKYFFEFFFQKFSKIFLKIFSIPKCYTILELWDQMQKIGFEAWGWWSIQIFTWPIYHPTFTRSQRLKFFYCHEILFMICHVRANTFTLLFFVVGCCRVACWAYNFFLSHSEFPIRLARYIFKVDTVTSDGLMFAAGYFKSQQAKHKRQW